MNIKGILISKCWELKWLFDIYFQRRHIAVNPTLTSTTSGIVMVLLPHADDELIGCDQLIKNNPDSIILNLDMNGGDTPEKHKERHKELDDYLDSVGKKACTIVENKVQTLRDAIIESNPKIIFVPSFFDWHPEHFEVMHYLASALDQVSDNYKNIDIAMYQVSVPLLAEYVNLVSPMNKKQFADKWHGFIKYYKSQLHLPLRRFGANERINGKLTGSYAAESYIVFNAKIWRELFQKACGQDMSFLQVTNINNLGLTRQRLSPLYNNIFN